MQHADLEFRMVHDAWRSSERCAGWPSGAVDRMRSREEAACAEAHPTDWTRLRYGLQSQSKEFGASAKKMSRKLSRKVARQLSRTLWRANFKVFVRDSKKWV